jgi:uncharacterized membrane protein YfcA
MNFLLLMFFGFITGLIDSIVGGGGLISLPFLSWYIAPGPIAIGTNKIVGTVGALVALVVYTKKGHLQIKEGILFCIICALGSFTGSSAAPYFPIQYFKILLILMCPVILFIIYKKDNIFSDENRNHKMPKILFYMAAFGSGFYDGFFGPGGGTFMFLSLFFGTSMPVLSAIAISKLANTFSASTALVTYAHNHLVHFKEGLLMAFGMALGAFLGANFATKVGHKILRPTLTVVVLLLMLNLIYR